MAQPWTRDLDQVALTTQRPALVWVKLSHMYITRNENHVWHLVLLKQSEQSLRIFPLKRLDDPTVRQNLNSRPDNCCRDTVLFALIKGIVKPLPLLLTKTVSSDPVKFVSVVQKNNMDQLLPVFYEVVLVNWWVVLNSSLWVGRFINKIKKGNSVALFVLK